MKNLLLFAILVSINTQEWLYSQENTHYCNCPKSEYEKSRLKHILNKHHVSSPKCFFCDKYLGKKTNYASHKHYMENHTELLIGLYLHYYPTKNIARPVSQWNLTLYAKYIAPNKILECKFQCQICKKKSFQLYSSIFHFISAHILPKLDSIHRENITSKDILWILRDRYLQDFKTLNQDFQKAFPPISLHYNGELTLCYNQNHKKETVSEDALKVFQLAALVQPSFPQIPLIKQTIDISEIKKCEFCDNFQSPEKDMVLHMQQVHPLVSNEILFNDPLQMDFEAAFCASLLS